MSHKSAHEAERVMIRITMSQCRSPDDVVEKVQTQTRLPGFHFDLDLDLNQYKTFDLDS